MNKEYQRDFTSVSKEVNDFFEREHIDVDEIMIDTDSNQKDMNELNYLAWRYGIYKNSKMKNVCLADITGPADKLVKALGETYHPNIFLQMHLLYNSVSEKEYFSRDLKLLGYSRDEIIEVLRKSFVEDPINTKTDGNGHYVIDENGFHRFALLKVLYLDEIHKAKGDQKKIDEINQKYTIPISVCELDEERTYCNYLITTYGLEERTEIYDYDDRAICIKKLKPRPWKPEKSIVGNNEIIQYTKRIIKEHPAALQLKYSDEYEPMSSIEFYRFKNDLKMMEQYYQLIPSFKRFIDENFSEIFLNQDPTDTEDIRSKI